MDTPSGDTSTKPAKPRAPRKPKAKAAPAQPETSPSPVRIYPPNTFPARLNRRRALRGPAKWFDADKLAEGEKGRNEPSRESKRLARHRLRIVEKHFDLLDATGYEHTPHFERMERGIAVLEGRLGQFENILGYTVRPARKAA